VQRVWVWPPIRKLVAWVSVSDRLQLPAMCLPWCSLWSMIERPQRSVHEMLPAEEVWPAVQCCVCGCRLAYLLCLHVHSCWGNVDQCHSLACMLCVQLCIKRFRRSL